MVGHLVPRGGPPRNGPKEQRDDSTSFLVKYKIISSFFNNSLVIKSTLMLKILQEVKKIMATIKSLYKKNKNPDKITTLMKKFNKENPLAKNDQNWNNIQIINKSILK